MSDARLAELERDWTADEAIAVLCRALAKFLRQWGNEGDADAVELAEHVLRRPLDIRIQQEIKRLRVENERLRVALIKIEMGHSKTESGRIALAALNHEVAP